MIIRGPPPSTLTTTVWAHGPTVWVNSSQKTTGNQLTEPHVYQGSPPHQHTQPLCRYTKPLCGSIHLKTVLENNCQGPMFIRGPPPINTHNHCVGTRNHCVSQFTSKNYWKTTFRAPCLSRVTPPPPQHNQPLCRYTKPLCRSIHLKTALVNNVRAPCLSGVPPHQHTQPLCGHTKPLCW